MMVLRDYWELEDVLETRDSGRHLLEATPTPQQSDNSDSTRKTYPTWSLGTLFCPSTVLHQKERQEIQIR